MIFDLDVTFFKFSSASNIASFELNPILDLTKAWTMYALSSNHIGQGSSNPLTFNNLLGLDHFLKGSLQEQT